MSPEGFCHPIRPVESSLPTRRQLFTHLRFLRLNLLRRCLGSSNSFLGLRFFEFSLLFDFETGGYAISGLHDSPLQLNRSSFNFGTVRLISAMRGPWSII